MDHSGVNGLSCWSSQSRMPWHTALNDIVRQALSATNVPATLEPLGLRRVDGKIPDGLTITPWAKGHALVWDVTCWDFAQSNIQMSSSQVRLLANHAATKKQDLHAELSVCHIFQPITFEATGVFGQDALDFRHDDLATHTRTLTHAWPTNIFETMPMNQSVYTELYIYIMPLQF